MTHDDGFLLDMDDAFLLDILATPEDDTPRRIYADWLEEQGNPRGEFIHVQCLLARMPEEDPRRPLLEARQCELLDHYQDEWLGSLRPLLSGWTFRRGFLDAITVPAAVYVQQAFFSRPASVRTLAVDVGGFEAPPAVLEFLPESVARENRLLPIGFHGSALVLAAGGPLEADLLDMLVFILNRDIELVATAGPIDEAIDRHYGQMETASVITSCFHTFDAVER